jgi:hypothetical protein
MADLPSFRALKLRQQRLLNYVRKAIAQATAGQLFPLNTEATKAEARRRYMANSMHLRIVFRTRDT